jgi:hypothetical protein
MFVCPAGYKVRYRLAQLNFHTSRALKDDEDDYKASVLVGNGSEPSLLLFPM